MNTARLGVVLPALCPSVLQSSDQLPEGYWHSFPVTLQQGKLAHITLWTPTLYRSRWHAEPESPGELQYRMKALQEPAMEGGLSRGMFTTCEQSGKDGSTHFLT